ncbi:Zinc finger, PMZ-type [Trema orientale]|uniref:Zinc finger, PMZ-type n=1 Tax=Trema orientale TaxID=63057 RepID=A0A2P5EBB4_TREOI|nr:Zinc finger, PMZ-type [Trema orientale]
MDKSAISSNDLFRSDATGIRINFEHGSCSDNTNEASSSTLSCITSKSDSNTSLLKFVEASKINILSFKDIRVQCVYMVKSQDFLVHTIGFHQHQVIDGFAEFVVYMTDKTCSCRKWELDLISCPHTCVVINRFNLSFIDGLAAQTNKVEKRVENKLVT